MDLTGKIVAPWDEQTVHALTAYQRAGVGHPYTCGVSSAHGQGILYATRDGWRCVEPGCRYRQNWTHAFSVTPQARTLPAELGTDRPWYAITPDEARDIRLPAAGIVGPLNDEGAPCPWPWDPELWRETCAMGMYHCPHCGAMVMAGWPHLDYRDDDTDEPATGDQ